MKFSKHNLENKIRKRNKDVDEDFMNKIPQIGDKVNCC